ncbi:hypothetical protein GQ600_27244 [Phytophthora cactorum]|nr:hypothetical protein GQ600_27244 [Phytophthora cactorum]
MAPSPSPPNQTADKPPHHVELSSYKETTQEASGEDNFLRSQGPHTRTWYVEIPLRWHSDNVDVDPFQVGSFGQRQLYSSPFQAQARLASPSLHHSSSVPTRMPASFVARHVGYPDPSHRPPPLVDVPATLADLSAGAAVRDGVRSGCLSDRDLVDLARIIPDNIRRNCLVVLLAIHAASRRQVRGRIIRHGCPHTREVVPALKFYGVEDFSRRVRKAPRYIHLLLAYIRDLETSADNSHVVRDAELRTEYRVLRDELERFQEYWVARLAHESESQAQQRECDREDSAYRHRADLEARDQRIQRLEVQVASGESAPVGPRPPVGFYKLASLLLGYLIRGYGRLQGNWERLLALLEHCRDNPEPPNDWMSRLDVDHLKAADYTVSPDPSLQERIAKGMGDVAVPIPTATAFQGTQPGVTPVDTSTQVTRDPAYLNLSPGDDKGEKGPLAKSAKLPARKLLKGPSASPSRRPRASPSPDSDQLVDLTTTPTTTPPQTPATPQTRPLRYTGGTRGTRARTAPHTVSITSSTASLPSGVSWKDVRTDIRELMLYGSSCEDALTLARQDVGAASMLESMAHWHQMDEPPWVRNVPEQYLDLAIAELHKRDDPPPPWPPLPTASLTLQEPKGSDISNEFMSDLSSSSSNSGNAEFLEALAAPGKRNASQQRRKSTPKKPRAQSTTKCKKSRSIVVVIPASQLQLSK